MSQPVQKKQVPGWKRSTVRYGFVIMALVWLAISATTSAAFFWQYLPNLLPFDMAGNVANEVINVDGRCYRIVEEGNGRRRWWAYQVPGWPS